MNDFDPTHGTAYANDPDYDRMTGRVAHHSEIIGITLDGWKVRHTVTVIDLGRSAPVAQTDPDGQLKPEQLEYDDVRTKAVAAGLRASRLKRTAELMEAMVACLAEHGPMAARPMGQRIAPGADRRILDALRENPDRFVYLGGPKRVWGLPGQVLPTKKPTVGTGETVRTLRAALEAHGPQTLRELTIRLGMKYSTLYDALARTPDWFCVVGTKPAVGTGPDVKVWGLR